MSIRYGREVFQRLVSEPPKNIAEEILHAGRQVYCSLYSQHPGWSFNGQSLRAPIIKRVLDDFCQEFPPIPPLPPPPFKGGQCEGSLYMVSVTFNRYFNEAFVQEQTFRFSGVPGIIQGAIDRISPDDSRVTEIVVLTTNPPRNSAVYRRPVGGTGITAVITNVYVQPERGQKDDCGDVNYDPYPEDSPPTDNDLNQTYNVTNFEGDTYQYDITINRDGGGGISFVPTINVGGVALNLDIDGGTLGNDTNRPSGDGGGSGGGGLVAQDDLVEDPEDIEEDEEDEEEEETGTDKLIAIVVSIVTQPSNASVTFGNDSPDVRYSGWIMFKNNGAFYERRFMHFDVNRFQAPDDNDGYAVYYKEGYAGIVTEIRESDQQESE